MGVFNPDNLIISIHNEPETGPIKLPAGEYKRGMVIGKDGSNYGVMGTETFTADKIDCVLTQDITSTGEITTSGYLTGKFRKSALIAADGFDMDTIVDPARKIGIFVE